MFLTFYETFLSPQVKWGRFLVTNMVHTNDLRFSTLGNLEKLEKSQNFI